MPTTTNYGWTTPADTDLVKDGAAAIRTLGSSIDTTVFSNASAGIPKTIVDAKGDLIAATAADTVARLAVGSNDQVLIADSTTATGLKWGTAAAGGITQIATTTATSSASVTFSSIAGTYRNLYVVYQNFIPVGNGDPLTMRFNGVSSGYLHTTTYGTNNDNPATQTEIQVSSSTRNSSAAGMGYIFIPNYGTTASNKICDYYGFTRSSITAANFNVYRGHAMANSTSAISSISFQSPSATFSGVFTLFGVQ